MKRGYGMILLLVFPGVLSYAGAGSHARVDQLIRGRWQSTEDKLSGVEFDGVMRIASYQGEKEPAEKYFLGDRCGSGSGLRDSKEGARPDCELGYIWVKNEDLCWCIIEVSPHVLKLSYVGRGNTLTYRKLPN